MSNVIGAERKDNRNKKKAGIFPGVLLWGRDYSGTTFG